jgi:hypothetical protein
MGRIPVRVGLEHPKPIDLNLVDKLILVLLASGDLHPHAAFDKDAVAVLAHQNHVEIPAYLIGKRLCPRLRLRNAAAIRSDFRNGIELPRRAGVEHKVDTWIEAAFCHDGDAGFFRRGREIHDRSRIVRGDQRRARFDRDEDGLAHQRQWHEIDDRVDAAHDVGEHEVGRPFRPDEPDAVQIRQAREPGGAVRRGVDADHLLDTGVVVQTL